MEGSDPKTQNNQNFENEHKQASKQTNKPFSFSFYFSFLKKKKKSRKFNLNPTLLLSVLISTPTSKRQNLVDQFNAYYSEEFIFLLSAHSGGTGLNLVGASRIVLFDIDWNPAIDLQAMSRIWRDGPSLSLSL